MPCARGLLPGPRLWVSSPQLSGDSGANTLLVRNAAEARAAVRSAQASGYDFIKLTTNITPEVYAAIMAEALAAGMRVTGHVDPRVGVAAALAAGQQIEHFDNYMESILADSAPSRVSVSDVGAYRAANWNSLAYVDLQKLAAIAGATARAGVYVTPDECLLHLLVRHRVHRRTDPGAPRLCVHPPGDEGSLGAFTHLLLEESAHRGTARAVRSAPEPDGAGGGGLGRRR